jgi:predicted AlkP superfamily phosphohydrolase/phosphomutase
MSEPARKRGGLVARHLSDRRRVLILGLDGADWTVIDPLIERGRMPNLSSLIARGNRSPLASTIPPVSAAAWVTFLLGAGPGTHGVLDFRRVDAHLYEGTDGHVVTSNDYPKRTFFDVAGAAGRRVASVRVPMTYPAWPVNGVMVSGPPTPNDRRLYTEPADLASSLAVGEVDIGNRLLEYPLDRQLEILRVQLQRSATLGRRTAGLESFDLTMVAVNTPDNAHHCFWHMRDDSGEDPVDRLYEEVDRFVGEMAGLQPWDLVVVMSDHGGGPRPDLRLATNAWLAEIGALAPKGEYRAALSRIVSMAKRHRKLVRLGRKWAPRTVQRRVDSMTQFSGSIDWIGTTAFGVHLFHPYVGIELNLRGRQPQGIVPPEAFHGVRTRLVRNLQESATTLSLPVESVRTREQAYGPGADPRLPDIVVRLSEAAEATNEVCEPMVAPSDPPGSHETKAYHAPYGILVVSGAGVRVGRSDRARIEDVAPTVLAYLGIAPPTEMTGRILSELFDDGALEARPRRPPALLPAVTGGTVTPAEEREIVAALRGLGYLE